MAQAATAPRIKAVLRVAGPGIAAMLADTDVGSLITAAQSGARWGYRLLLIQFALIPMLFIVQDLTSRLGTHTGQGHGELILKHYGRFWGWVSFGGLVVAGLGAILTELSGFAGIGDLYGLSRWISLGLPVALLLLIVYTGSYRRIERISILVGLFELVFLWLAWRSHPSGNAILSTIWHLPVGNSGFRTLVSANIGAVIMPWMVFYQQSAVADKGLKQKDYRATRWDTAIGAVVSQVIMSALLIAAAATLHKNGQTSGLNTVGDLSRAFTPALGALAGRAVFSIGIIAAAFIALNVVSLALAWNFGAVTGVEHSLRRSPREAPWFYGIYTVVIVAGAAALQLIPNLVSLNIAVEVINALLLPLTLGFLVLLATRALPPDERARGPYKWAIYTVTGITVVFGFVGALSELF